MTFSFDPLDIGSRWWDLNRSLQLNLHELQEIQVQRFHKLLGYALKHSPIYRKKYGRVDQSAVLLHELPSVTKKELMAHFSDWVTDSSIQLAEVKKFLSDPRKMGQLYLDQYTIWESSGSSGIPGIFIESGEAMSIYDALEFFRKSTYQKIHQCLDPFCLSDRVALVVANTGHFASIVSFERMRAHYPYLQDHFQSFSILESYDALVNQLNTFGPNVLVTYPSAAVMLATAKKRGDLQIKLAEVLTGGENLTAAMKTYLQEVFDCEVINSYGASEFLPIAWACDAGKLHVNADWVILEPVDKNYQPIPLGQMSHTTLLTNLANYVQPLIRYDLGDSVCIHQRPCSCGCHLPTIELLGRCDDVLCMKNAAGEWVELLPLAIATVLEEEAHVFDFQIEQIAPQSLSIALPMSQKDGGAIMRRCKKVLGDYLSEQGIQSMRWIEKFGAQKIWGRSGKIKRIMAHQYR